ncbi:MAG: amino acid ABC transporter substrate-binding protein [Acidimicrobiaceae bacterium]|nr:amino acid ABC transporter substrate-binding protein [Acidimicrobiaceae bacterium]MCY4295076.1 amino acid ABC transporter substrate-binding protein [Acidimicrobiaceae bacterium]
MTKNKSLLWRALAVLFCISLIAASCGDDDDDSGTTQQPATTTAAAATDDEPAADTTTTAAADVIENTQDGDLLATVMERGKLHCGVSGAAVAFSETQPDGTQTGFDADYCRAVAAAIFGDADAVEYVPLTAAERFTAVQTGAVDVLMRNTTWTQGRDTEVGMDFGPTTYYDGQQLMARVSDGFSNSSQISDIDGAVVCTNAGTTTEQNIADAAEEAGVSITLNTFEDFDIVTTNFVQGACDIVTTDGSALVGRKANQEPDDQEWVIFPPTPISKEPLGPTYGQNQSRFADVVNWTVYATVIADEKGVNSSNVDAMAANPPDAEVGRLLGGEGELQSAMGLAPDAFWQVIKQVGNYDEIYSRNLNPVGLTREGSANAGWLDGGLIYAPPAR